MPIIKGQRADFPNGEIGALRFSDDYSSTPLGKYCKKDNTMYFWLQHDIYPIFERYILVHYTMLFPLLGASVVFSRRVLQKHRSFSKLSPTFLEKTPRFFEKSPRYFCDTQRLCIFRTKKGLVLRLLSPSNLQCTWLSHAKIESTRPLTSSLPYPLRWNTKKGCKPSNRDDLHPLGEIKVRVALSSRTKHIEHAEQYDSCVGKHGSPHAR